MQNAAAAEWKGQAVDFESQYKKAKQAADKAEDIHFAYQSQFLCFCFYSTRRRGGDGSTKQTETRSLKSVPLRFGIAMAAVMIMLADVRTLATAVVSGVAQVMKLYLVFTHRLSKY
eukprot:g20520.t1